MQREERAVQAHQSAWRDAPVEAHARQDRRAGDGDDRAHPELAHQRIERQSHSRQRKLVGRSALGKAMAGQIGRDDCEARGEQRGKRAPRMGRCAGAVHQQHDGPVAELLDVPAQAGGARKPAALAVRPIAPVALPDQPVGHYRLISRRTDTGCARTACEIAAEPAAGSGQRQVGRVHLGGKPARLGLRPHGGVEIRREDFRLTRFTRRTPTTVIFAVDASGSSALHRLAETKGAVELLLAECYVRRDRVAPIAFRRQRAELLLPPTRSLARARRNLAGLPGGDATPLAAGIEAAAADCRLSSC